MSESVRLFEPKDAIEGRGEGTGDKKDQSSSFDFAKMLHQNQENSFRVMLSVLSELQVVTVILTYFKRNILRFIVGFYWRQNLKKSLKLMLI